MLSLSPILSFLNTDSYGCWSLIKLYRISPGCPNRITVKPELFVFSGHSVRCFFFVQSDFFDITIGNDGSAFHRGNSGSVSRRI